MSKEVLLDVRHLTQQFHLTKKIKVKAVDDAPVTEGTDVKVNEEETVPADKKEEVEAAKPKPVSKGNRRGSKALQLELEKAVGFSAA